MRNTEEYEEYKYRLFFNENGDTALLREFFDSIPSREQQYIYALELEDAVLTISWTPQIPRAWQERTHVKFPDGKEVELYNVQHKETALAPSLVETLEYLDNAKKKKKSKGSAPEKLNEKIDALESCGLIEVEREIKKVAPANGDYSKLMFTMPVRDVSVTSKGRDILRKAKKNSRPKEDYD